MRRRASFLVFAFFLHLSAWTVCGLFAGLLFFLIVVRSSYLRFLSSVSCPRYACYVRSSVLVFGFERNWSLFCLLGSGMASLTDYSQ
jgi:hypothetical protein